MLDEGETVILKPVFAVTHEEDGRRKTFFVRVWVERVKLDNNRVDWCIVGSESGIRPEGW
jgi:hypothetical protein